MTISAGLGQGSKSSLVHRAGINIHGAHWLPLHSLTPTLLQKQSGQESCDHQLSKENNISSFTFSFQKCVFFYLNPRSTSRVCPAGYRLEQAHLPPHTQARTECAARHRRNRSRHNEPDIKNRQTNKPPHNPRGLPKNLLLLG